MARRRASSTRKTAPARTLKHAGGKTVLASLPSQMRCKFTLYNLLGKPLAYYLVDCEQVRRPGKSGRKKSVAHSILVLDRSGSMRPHIEDLKRTLIKLLTLDEYSQYDLLVTLITYSSEGDCRVHFTRSPIQEIMKPGSRPLKEIKKMHVAGRTCISHALQLAASVARDEEVTAITLHSDGYANDPSPRKETRMVESLCGEMRERPLFVNTIAYTDYSDFRLLARVANMVSGSCLRTSSIKEVYDSLYDTEKLLGSPITPPFEIDLPDGCVYQVFVSHSGGKLLGSAGPLNIRGLRDKDDAVVYRYTLVNPADYPSLDAPETQTSEPVLAFARALLAEGSLNTAKHALASSYDATLIERHARALTNVQIGALAQDLDNLLFQPGILAEHQVLDRVPVNNRISLLALARLLSEHRDAFVVNLDRLNKVYVRRGLRRIPGTRDESGSLIAPVYKAEPTDPGDYAAVASFDINRNTANLNMLVARPVQLAPAAGGPPVTEVAGIRLENLKMFNTYTLVGDGDLNVPALQIKISQEKLFEGLVAEGVLEQEGKPADRFDPSAEYTLKLDNLPLVPPFEGKVELDGVFEELAEVKVLQSIVSAHLKEVSSVYTPEQVEVLKKHYLSKHLNLNFPTTTEYTDLDQALAEGTVDYRVSYKIDIGNTSILNLGKLIPANKFLERMYELIDADAQKIESPTFEALLDSGVTVRHKRLSSRTRVTPVDGFMRRIFDDFLGLDSSYAAEDVLEHVGAGGLVEILESRRHGGKVDRKDHVAALTEAQQKLDAYAERLIEERISPLVFYIGSTGVLPDEMEARALTAEELKEAYPDLSLSKDEQEGMFFVLGETILSVYCKDELFTRSEGTQTLPKPPV